MTRNRLLKIGIPCDQICILRNLQTESHSHLFFDCDYTSGILTSLLKDLMQIKVNPKQGDSIAQVLAVRGGGKLTCKLAGGSDFAVYMCWIEKNGNVFKGVQRDHFQIIKECDRLVISRFSEVKI